MSHYPTHCVPVVFLGKCIVSIDVALAFGEHETTQYTRNPINQQWRAVAGDKNGYCFYPQGMKDTA